MEETNSLNQVAEFHRVFEQPILDTPQIPRADRVVLRIDLLQEEFQELKDAIINEDLVEIADALVDIQYILSGTVLEFGLGGIFKQLNDEVHRSNMSKACTSISEATKTHEAYENKGDSSTITTSGSKFLVRRHDGKVLKSINYSPANLKPIIENT